MKKINHFLELFSPCRFLNRRGQHLMEYTMVLTLVVATVITMGPYVIRAWNASLKGWEDSAEDSFRDPLQEAPDDIQLPYCTCEDWIEGACGAGPCTDFERYYMRPCSPAGCSNQERCVLDCDCCTYIAYQCGVSAAAHPCEDGYRLYSVQCCDQASPHWECIYDVDCVFICVNPFPPTPAEAYKYGDVCEDDTVDLTGDMLWIAVDGDVPGPDGCTDTRKCQQKCADGFEPSAGNASCECPGDYIDNGSACVCDWQYGYVEQSVCGNTACGQNGCSAGRCSDRPF